MALKTRGDFFPVETRIDTTQIVPASRLVSQITGFVVQPNRQWSGRTPLRTPRAFTRTA